MASLLWQHPGQKGNREAGAPIGGELSITAGEPKANPRKGTTLQWDPIGVQLPVTAGTPRAHPRTMRCRHPPGPHAPASRRPNDVGVKCDPYGVGVRWGACPRVRCAYPRLSIVRPLWGRQSCGNISHPARTGGSRPITHAGTPVGACLRCMSMRLNGGGK